jgi:hypothetical protein
MLTRIQSEQFYKNCSNGEQMIPVKLELGSEIINE